MYPLGGAAQYDVVLAGLEADDPRRDDGLLEHRIDPQVLGDELGHLHVVARGLVRRGIAVVLGRDG
jgi:hypothetical protein